MLPSNGVVKVRVKSAGLGNHNRLGELIKGAIHSLPRNEVGTELFDIIEYEYNGVDYSSAEILALHKRAKGSKRRDLAAFMVARGITK